MKKLMLKAGFVIITLCMALPLHAQSSAANPGQGFDMTGFPQWTKDLRRAEIVAIGSFPFTLFFTTFFYDAYRTTSHGGDMRYAPWPINPAGSIGMTQNEHLLTLGIAVGGSILIAVADHIIVRYRRSKQEQELRNLPVGTPIIIRRPVEEGSSGESQFIFEAESETP